MNNLQVVIPDSWICPGHHGHGSRLRHAEACRHRPAIWLGVGRRNLRTRVLASLIPTITVIGNIFRQRSTSCQHNPDFFQIIDYAMNQGNGGVNDPNHVRNTFTIGAALIDQYDTDDLYDPDPNAAQRQRWQHYYDHRL